MSYNRIVRWALTLGVLAARADGLRAQEAPVSPAAAIAALQLVREDTTFGLHRIAPESILVDLSGIFEAQTPASRVTEVGRLLRARGAVGPHADCASGQDTDARAKRAQCALKAAEYYLEVARDPAKAGTGIVRVLVFRRASERRQGRIPLNFVTHFIQATPNGSSWTLRRLPGPPG